MTRPTKLHVHPAKTQISLGISLNGKLRTHAFFMRTAKTERMPRLIPVFLDPKFIVFVVVGSHDKVLFQILSVLDEKKRTKTSL